MSIVVSCDVCMENGWDAVSCGLDGNALKEIFCKYLQGKSIYKCSVQVSDLGDCPYGRTKSFFQVGDSHSKRKCLQVLQL